MADLVEALHNLARQRGRGDASPLLGVRHIAAREGGRISHLPISQRLEQAWIKLTGQPFRQHQSMALSALRRGEPFALIGGGPVARQTLHLLTLEVLRAEPQATAILLAPDDDGLALHLGELERMSQLLAQPVPVGVASGPRARQSLGARAILTTPESLHDRLLRRHDRTWAALWSRLRLLVVADAHRYDGLAASHLSALLLRAARLAPDSPPLQLAAGVADVAGADVALAQINGLAWRLIPTDDVPRPDVAVALWRAGADRLREAAAVALGMERAGATVHVVCTPLEAGPLRGLIGADVAAVSVAHSVLPAQVQVLTGAAAGGAALREAGESGARLVVLLLGAEPAERTIARLALRGDGPLPLVDGPPPVWAAAPLNAYVAAQHLLCAASERPVSAEELARWGYDSFAARLEQRGELARLPDPEPLWQPRAGDDPYFGLGLRAAGVAPVLASDEQGAPLGALDPAAFDRWAFRGAALPPLRGGLRVVARDEERLSLTLRPDGDSRRTLPLRRCSARVRDTRERRSLRGGDLGWGRVIVEEEVYGYREVTGGNAPAERALSPTLSTSWSAPALWIDLPAPAPAAPGQLVGWSLVAALPLLALGDLGDLVPAYDAEARRLLFVDANPGGNGLSAWLFDHLEEVLPLAYDVALDCGGDTLLDPIARADKDWLLGLLSGLHGPREARGQASRELVPAPAWPLPQRREEPAEPPRRSPAPPPAPPRQEPPAPPRQAVGEVPRAEPPLRREPARVEPPASREQPRPEPPARERSHAEPPLRREPMRAEPEAREDPAGRERREGPPARERPLPDTGRQAVGEGEGAEPSPRGFARAEQTDHEGRPEARGAPREAPPLPETTGGAAAEVHDAEAPPGQPALPLEPAPAPPQPPRREPTGRQKRKRDREPTRPAERREPPATRPTPAPRNSEPPAPRPERTPRGGAPAPPLAPPSREAPPSQPEPEPVLPDAAAMVARLRRLREQREQRERPPPRQAASGSADAEPRFRPGDTVHCTPYGEGEVLSSRIADDRELLVVRFPDHGELTVDAAVGAVRLVAAAPEPEPDF